MLCAGLVVRAHADDAEFSPQNEAWNGLSELVALGRALAIDVRTPKQLALSELRQQDGLLVVYPASPPPQQQLSAFMAQGGRLAIADDFGAAGELLRSLGVDRAPPKGVDGSRRLRGNRNLLIADARRAHPLTEDVGALVTNHPRVLRHSRLDPLFGFEDVRAAVVLTGSVGAGRLVAIGDPSVLINNMLAFRGNRAFARNLLRFLAPRGRVWIAAPSSALRGEYREAQLATLADMRSAMQRMARLALPEAALKLTTLVMACLLLIAAASGLPRRAAYLRAVSLPVAETFAGFAGRVRLFSRKRANLTLPALSYKLGFEQRLVQVLNLPSRSGLRDVADALRAANLPAREVARAERLLIELQSLSAAHEQGSSAARIGERKFHAIVRTGERILAALGDRRAQDFPA